MSEQTSGFEWIFLIVFAIIFYFIIYRPQAKKQKELQNLITSLQKGDEIITISGIIGKINKLNENYFILEVDEKIELKFARSAVATILPKGTIKEISKDSV